MQVAVFLVFLYQMLPYDTRRKIKNITSGAVIEGASDTCTAIRNSLCSRFGTSVTDKKDFESKSVIKEEQAHLIEEYCNRNHFWYELLPNEERYLTRGGEAKIYLHPDNHNVVKVNDAIYYATWLEFLNSLLLHNVLFQNTYYSLEGFLKVEGSLAAVLHQAFVVSDAPAEIDDIKKFLEFNGFENTKRNDYYHKELSLILEDMHDENVIVNSDTLFFIDTVFYAVKPLHFD